MFKRQGRNEEVMMKVCKNCNGRYPEDYFWRRKDGELAYNCKQCKTALDTEFWQNKLRKKCATCETYKMLDPFFWRDFNGIPARNCKQCNTQMCVTKKVL